jgi:hypothetical protein
VTHFYFISYRHANGYGSAEPYSTDEPLTTSRAMVAAREAIASRIGQRPDHVVITFVMPLPDEGRSS